MAFVSPNTWREWKKRCCIGGCDAEQRRELHSVVVFNLRQALSHWNAALPNYTDDDLASLFDEHFKLGLQETGAASKDHLFSMFAHVTDEQAWARLITSYIRTTARRCKSIAAEIARREGRTGPIEPGVPVDAIGAHTDDEGPSPGVIYLDPNVCPDALACATDLKDMAAKLAPGFFTRLDRAQKSVLWAYAVQSDEEMGKKASLNDPKVRTLAGRGLSSVYVAHQRLLEELKTSLRRTVGGDPEDIRALAGQVVLAMLPLAEKWEKAGKSSG